jgi:hypothetical protein
MADRTTDTQLAYDTDGSAIQVLAPGTPTNAAVGGSSAVTAIPTGAEILEISASTDCFILFTTSGGSVASTSGMFFPKGAAVYRVPSGATHVAHIQDSASGRIALTALT